MDKVIIRQVKINDLESCRFLEESCFDPNEAASKENIENRIMTYQEGFFVAQLGGQILGMINSGAIDSDDITNEEFKKLIGHVDSGKNIVIFSLVVHPDYQKIGIAKKLMLHFIDKAKEMGKEKVMLICKKNLIDYYKRYGFVYIGKLKSTHGGFEWHEMSLPII